MQVGQPDTFLKGEYSMTIENKILFDLEFFL